MMSLLNNYRRLGLDEGLLWLNLEENLCLHNDISSWLNGYFFEKNCKYFLFDLYTFYKRAFHLYKKKQIAGAAKAEVVICSWKINVKKGLVKEWLCLAAKYSLHRKNIASKKRPAETGPSGDFIQTQMLYRLTKRLIASKSKAYPLHKLVAC